MDYGRFLSRSWQITWRYKFLWLWSALAVLGTGGGGATSILLNLSLPADWHHLDQWLAQMEAGITDPSLLLGRMDDLLLWGTLLLFWVLLAGWFTFALAEGMVIYTVTNAEEERPVAFGSALRACWSWLGRFVAIDAAVFLPLFLLILILLLLAGGTLIGSVAAGSQQDLSGFLLPLGIGGLCLLPLLCLVGPLGVVTAVFRGLAFRDTAIYKMGVRDSMRHTWAVVRTHMGFFLIVTGLLWGLQTLLRLGVSLVSLTVVISVLPFMATVRPLITVILGLLAIFVLLLEAVLHTFTAVTWTMAYLAVSREL